MFKIHILTCKNYFRNIIDFLIRNLFERETENQKSDLNHLKICVISKSSSNKNNTLMHLMFNFVNNFVIFAINKI